MGICSARLKYLGEEIGQFSEVYMLGVRNLWSYWNLCIYLWYPCQVEPLSLQKLPLWGLVIYLSKASISANFKRIWERYRKHINYSPFLFLCRRFLPLVYLCHPSYWNLAHPWWPSSAIIGFIKLIQLPSGKCLLPILTSQLCCGVLTAFPSICLMVWFFTDLSDVLYPALGSMKRSDHIFLSCMRPSKGLSRDQ